MKSVRSRTHAVAFALALTVGCSGANRPIWHDQRLPSGRTIKVTSFNLVWGIEHDERDAAKDCFALEYVSSDPQASPQGHEAEAMEVFELIRPAAELWGMRTATLAAFPTLERKGRYGFYALERQSDGRWRAAYTERKVFATD